MPHVVEKPPIARDDEFAVLVETLVAEANDLELLDLLREDHPIYAQRGSSTVARMRGWVLLAIGRVGVADRALLFILEELDTGLDPYPVAAAARALRSYPRRSEAFAPFLLRALSNVRGHDERVSFDRYADYGKGSNPTSATREILLAVAWLGAGARSIVAELEAVRDTPGSLSSSMRPEIDRALSAIRSADVDDACCSLPGGLRPVFARGRDDGDRADGDRAVSRTAFQDHSGDRVTFAEFFHGQPAIVVFFYTRCDNPLKCSLTVTKLGRIQAMLEERGLAARIRTAAVTYDPGFDSSERLRSFGTRRGLRLGANHRMLRAVDGMDTLRRYFRLGVNFVGSLVNRHRVEAYVLDAEGRIVCAFERLRWNEHDVVDRAVAALNASESRRAAVRPARTRTMLEPLPSLALACLPKCPFCWASYVSAFGIAGLERMASLSWIQPVLLGAVALNLAAVWLRSRVTRRFIGASLSSAGAIGIVGAQFGVPLAELGVIVTFAGSLVAAFDARPLHGP
jgi:protein SCO1/2